MSSSVAKSALQIRQIYRLIQFLHKGDTEMIEKMIKLGVDNIINLTEPQEGIGLLHIAISANNQDMISFLLSKGASPDIQDKKGRSSVMLAAELGNDVIMEQLAQSHANFKLQDSEGKGVLFYCTFPTECHTQCLQVALKHQADVNNVSTEGDHIFRLMCENSKEFSSRCLSMLDAGTDPNATNERTGVTALMEAAKAGSPEVVGTILKKGGNPNAVDNKGSSAPHYAAMGGCFEVIPVLSAYSVDLDVVNTDTCTPMHYAAAAGNTNSCKFLAQRGCTSNLKNKEGLLPHQIAKDAGHKAAVKVLKKAQKEKKSSKESSESTFISDLWVLTLHDWFLENETELRQAFEEEESDTVTKETLISVLEELKAPVQQEQLKKIISALDQSLTGSVSINDLIKGAKYIKKPFLLASYLPKKKGGKGKKGKKGGKGKKGKKGKVLLEPIPYHPPDLMARRPDGGPPLFMIEKDTDTRRPEHHPIIDDSTWYTDKTEKTYISINYCVRRGDLKSIEQALAQGVPVDITDPYHKTPLMVACATGNYEIAQYLLSLGADVKAVDNFFWTPLHHAAYAGELQLVKLLVESGADIDAWAVNGGTPLINAIQKSRLSCVEFLINEGANVEAENKAGKNCLDIANNFGDTSIIELLKSKMDPPSEAEKGGKASKAKPAKAKAAK